MAEFVMFNAAVGEAFTVTVTTAALAEIVVWSICIRQLRVALSVLEVIESLRDIIDVPTPGAGTNPLTFSSAEPLMIGFAPLPYAPNVMGEPDEPFAGAVSVCPYQTSPRLNRTESPGWSVTPAQLFAQPGIPGECAHGVPVVVPLFESVPAAAT
jgi:hypothetical protein